MTATPIYQVDAFTDRAFAGNPAAVCPLDTPAEADWMQAVAREMNLSETAFLWPEGDGYRLRWFTPAVEVDLCGHATLATAHVLWENGAASPDQVLRFQTRSGLLTARRDGDWIELDFPASHLEDVTPPDGLLEALGVQALEVKKTRFDFLVRINSEDTLRALNPDHRALARTPARGVMVTCRPETGSDYDFLSRFFAPGAGIDEDPVTGSAHCALGPYWGAQLGKDSLLAYQASPRGGVMRVVLRGDRVGLGGQAVTVLQGELHIPA